MGAVRAAPASVDCSLSNSPRSHLGYDDLTCFDQQNRAKATGIPELRFALDDTTTMYRAQARLLNDERHTQKEGPARPPDILATLEKMLDT